MNKPTNKGGTITRGQYQHHTSHEWKGVRVQNVVKLENRLMSFPAGTNFTIEKKFTGFRLRSDTCKCCGVSGFVSDVDYSNLIIID